MGHQPEQHSHWLQWINSILNNVLSRLYKDMESLTLEETNGLIVVFFALTAFVLIYLYVKSQTPFYEKMGAARAFSNCCKMCLCECRRLYNICGNLTASRPYNRFTQSDFEQEGLLTQIGDLKREPDTKTVMFITGQLRNILRAIYRAQLFAKLLPSFFEMLAFACAFTLSLAIVIQSGRLTVAKYNYKSPFEEHRAQLNSNLMLIRGHSRSLDTLEQEMMETLTRACAYLKNPQEEFFDYEGVKGLLANFNDFSKLTQYRDYFNSDGVLKKLKDETYENALKLKNDFKRLVEILDKIKQISDRNLIDMENVLIDRPVGKCTNAVREGSEEAATVFDRAALKGYKRESEKIRNSLFLGGRLKEDFNKVTDDLVYFLFLMESQHTNLIYQALALAFVSVVGLTLGCYCKREPMIEYKNAFYKFYAIQMMLLIAILCYASLNLNEITNNRLSVLNETAVHDVEKILHKLNQELVVPEADTDDLVKDLELILTSISKLKKEVNITGNKPRDITHLINPISIVQMHLMELHHVMNSIHKISDAQLDRMKNKCAKFAIKKLNEVEEIHLSLVMVQIIIYSYNKEGTTMTNGLETLAEVKIRHDLHKLKMEIQFASSIGHELFNEILIYYRDTIIYAFGSIHSKYKMLLTALVFIFLASLHMCLYYK